MSRFYAVDIDEMDIEVEYRSFCLVYHQVYDETEPLKLSKYFSVDMAGAYIMDSGKCVHGYSTSGTQSGPCSVHH